MALAQESGFLDELTLDWAKWLVSTLPEVESNLALLNALKEHHFGSEVAFVARTEEHGLALKQAGAPTVLYPVRDAVGYTTGPLAALIHPNEKPE